MQSKSKYPPHSPQIREGGGNTEIHMEHKMVLDSKSKSEQKKQCWRDYHPRSQDNYRTILINQYATGTKPDKLSWLVLYHLESSDKKDPQLRKYPHKVQL